jgi:hypothetical protein
LKLRLSGQWQPNQFVTAICPPDSESLARSEHIEQFATSVPSAGL